MGAGRKLKVSWRAVDRGQEASRRQHQSTEHAADSPPLLTGVDERGAAEGGHLGVHNRHRALVGHAQVVRQAAHKPGRVDVGEGGASEWVGGLRCAQGGSSPCVPGHSKRCGTTNRQTALAPLVSHLVGVSPPRRPSAPSCPAAMAARTAARSIESRPDSVRGLTCEGWECEGRSRRASEDASMHAGSKPAWP